MNPEAKKFDVCLYHNNCPDGIGGAYPFWEIAQDLDNQDFMTLGVNHYEPWPKEVVTGKRVVIVDFSYKRSDLLDMSKVCNEILILDHHKTAEENLTGIDLEASNIKYIFDMDRSGAQIAWDYCYGDMTRPWFIDYIADRDLWKWELPFSKEINKALYFGGWLQFEKLDELYYKCDPETTKRKFTEQGKAFLIYEKKLINDAIKSSCKCEFEGHTILLTNCDRNVRSEVGAILAKKDGIDFSATWVYSFENKEWWISLRGSKDCEIPLHHIAQKFGGGGHFSAAAFTIKDDIHKYFKVIK